MSRVNLNNVKPPPLHGHLGKSYCKGVCIRYKSPKPNWGKDPYETHSYCRKCGGIWMKKESTIKSRCPCCNWLTANKSRKSKSSGSKKKVYYSV